MIRANFKKGDRVVCITTGSFHLTVGMTYEVVEDQRGECVRVKNNNGCAIGPYAWRFKLADKAAPFKAGDKVVLKASHAEYGNSQGITVGKIYTITDTQHHSHDPEQIVYFIGDRGHKVSAYAKRVEPASPKSDPYSIVAEREKRKAAEAERKAKGRARQEALVKAQIATLMKPTVKPLHSVMVSTDDLYAAVAAWIKEHHGIDRKVKTVTGRLSGQTEVVFA